MKGCMDRVRVRSPRCCDCAAAGAADIKVDLTKEQVGRPPATFEPMVGTWVVAQDGADKVIMVDGRPWVASKDNPTKLLIESARKLYGTSNEELMDNAKQFAYYPVAVLRGVDNFTNGSVGPAAGRGQGRVVGEDRQHQLLQGLRDHARMTAVRVEMARAFRPAPQSRP